MFQTTNQKWMRTGGTPLKKFIRSRSHNPPPVTGPNSWSGPLKIYVFFTRSGPVTFLTLKNKLRFQKVSFFLCVLSFMFISRKEFVTPRCPAEIFLKTFPVGRFGHGDVHDATPAGVVEPPWSAASFLMIHLEHGEFPCLHRRSCKSLRPCHQNFER